MQGALTHVTRSFRGEKKKRKAIESLSPRRGGGLAYIKYTILDHSPKLDLACIDGDRRKIHFSNMGGLDIRKINKG